jgi:hypothetical protein
MKVLKCFAITSRVLPMLVAAIALAVATDDAFAKNGSRSGTGNTESKSLLVSGTAEKPAPGRPIGKPLPPIPIDPGKGDGRVGHDGRSDHRHSDRHEGRHRDRDRGHKHKHSRYESPPIIGKKNSDLFRRGVVGPQPGAGATTKPVPVLIGR